MPGSSPLDGSETSVSRAIAWAAARNSGSDMTDARQMIVPSPSPGNISALLACPIRYIFPLRSTGPNGLPVATSASPSVQASRFAGVCSASTVGLDIGSTIGRSQCACIERTTSSVNAPVTPEVPTSIVGCRFATTSARPRSPLADCQPATLAGSFAYGC